MRVIIVEDEELSAERIRLLLQQIDGSMQVVAVLENVEEAVEFFIAGNDRYARPGTAAPMRRVPFKSRLLGRIGQRLFFINSSDIAMITADNRIVQVVAMDRTRYLVDHTLEELENHLEPSSFFRINRKTIVSARAIEQIKPFINHRLKLVLKSPLQTEEIIVSRDRVPEFKKWAES